MQVLSIYKLIILIAVLGISTTLNGQNPVGEVSTKDEKDEYRTRFVFSFDARNSFVIGQPVKFNGFKFGLEVRKRHRFGLGFYSLRYQVKLNDVGLASGLVTDIFFDYNLATTYYEFVVLHKNKWELTLPAHIVSGDLLASREDSTGKRVAVPELSKPTRGLEWSVDAQYTIIPWLGVGAGLGYRTVLSSNNEAKRAFNGPMYFVKLKLFLGVFYRRIFKGEKRKQPAN